MTTLVAGNFIDLKIDLDISEVWNEARVMLPSYSYTYELQGQTWVRIPVDVSQRYVDGASVNKYGRRTQTISKHAIDQSFSEEYCQTKVDKYKEPCNKVDVNLMGKDDADTALVLSLMTKLASQISYIHAPTGLNSTGLIQKLDLNIDLDRVPRLTMTIEEARWLELSSWFIVDTDVIDGVNVIG